jgi:hypothetical protein
MGCARDPHSCCNDRWTSRSAKFRNVWIFPDEQRRSRVAQVGRVEFAVDCQGGAEFSRTVCERNGFRNVPVVANHFVAELRLDSANEDGFSAARTMANGIHTKMKTIDEIDVRPAWRAKHRAIPRCFATKAVRGGIIDEVGFRFHNWAAANPFRRISNEPMAQQFRRDQCRGRLIKRPPERREYHRK